MNPVNCPKCDSPLNGGECDLCRSLASLVNESPIPETKTPVWNWEQFYMLIRNDEHFTISQTDSDEKIEERILANMELERQSSLMVQSFRIRIQEDKEELKRRGKESKHKQSLTDLNYKPLGPIAGLPRRSAVKLSKEEQLKKDLESRGIDFDKFMADLDKAGL